jgi:hypothetical protein
MEILQQLANTACGEGLLKKRQQRFVRPRTKLLQKEIEANSERHNYYAQHQASMGVVSEMGSSREIKGVQGYSDDAE